MVFLLVVLTLQALSKAQNRELQQLLLTLVENLFYCNMFYLLFLMLLLGHLSKLVKGCLDVVQ
jgi:hypothetical protein